VLIFSELRAGAQYGYVFDGWRDGIFHYTGAGQVDHQQMQAAPPLPYFQEGQRNQSEPPALRPATSISAGLDARASVHWPATAFPYDS
jgi:hypothetical protein